MTHSHLPDERSEHHKPQRGTGLGSQAGRGKVADLRSGPYPGCVPDEWHQGPRNNQERRGQKQVRTPRFSPPMRRTLKSSLQSTQQQRAEQTDIQLFSPEEWRSQCENWKEASAEGRAYWGRGQRGFSQQGHRRQEHLNPKCPSVQSMAWTSQRLRHSWGPSPGGATTAILQEHHQVWASVWRGGGRGKVTSSKQCGAFCSPEQKPVLKGKRLILD